MSNSVLLFLMGPPVSGEFAALIQPILQEFCQGNCRDIQIADVSGPVHYLEDWMDVGSRTRRERRLGLRMVDLWALRITWTGSSMMHRSWTVIVKDQAFFAMAPALRRDSLPEFETFVVAVADAGEVLSGNVFDHTVVKRDGWQRRGYDGQTPTLADRDSALRVLQAPMWHGLLNIQALFPSSSAKPRAMPHVAFTSKAGKTDTTHFLPRGLPHFLTLSATRPDSYESLLRELYDYHQRCLGRTSKLKPTWFPSGITLNRITEPSKLAQWWWASFVAHAAKEVQQLLDRSLCRDSSCHLCDCDLLFGTSPKFLRAARLDAASSPSPDDILEQCRVNGFRLFEVKSGDGPRRMVRGLTLSSGFAVDLGELRQRALLLDWTFTHIDGQKLNCLLCCVLESDSVSFAFYFAFPLRISSAFYNLYILYRYGFVLKKCV